MLFCLPHWRALPKKVQDAVWREYRSGQEIDKKPSLRYLAVQKLACAYSVFKPDDEIAVLEAIPFLQAATRYAKEAVAAGLGDPLENLVPKDWPVKQKLHLRVVR
jgi:hypothetical protein